MLKEATISERKIVNAFIELLEESSLEQISITDIIKKANLSRPTFYYYYSNKEDLVETTFSKILDKNLKYSSGRHDLPRRCCH